MSKLASKDSTIKKAEIKVLIICVCYVVLGLTAAMAYSISSAFLADHQRELMDYFECERCGVDSGRMCDRSGFERLTNPPLITMGYSVFVLYPVITLVYLVRLKRNSGTKRARPNPLNSKSTSSNLAPDLTSKSSSSNLAPEQTSNSNFARNLTSNSTSFSLVPEQTSNSTNQLSSLPETQ